MSTRTPNLFILGAPKCGTTAFAQYLDEHPNVFMCKPKEPNYFTREFPVYQARFSSFEEYLALFSAARPEHMCIGEASVWSLYSERAVPEILQRFPNSRFIVLLRNPVDMAVSLHSQMVLMQEETEIDFLKAWELQAERASGYGVPQGCREPTFLQYRKVCSLGTQLERLLNTVDSDRVKPILFDDFVQDTAKVYSSTLDFLSLPKASRAYFPQINANRTVRNQLVQRLLIRTPGLIRPLIRRSKKVLGIQRLGVMDKVLRFNMRESERNHLDPYFREYLIEAFADEIAKLEAIFGRQLLKWKVVGK